MRVIVVGGGPAGLTAAYTLKKCGASPIVLEEGPRLGGRVRTDRRGGFVIDLGAQLFSRRYTQTMRLCREFGLEDRLVSFPLVAGILRDDRICSGLALMSWRTAISFLHLVAWTYWNGSSLDTSSRLDANELGAVSTEFFARSRYGGGLLDEWLQPFVSGATAAMPDEVAALCTLSYLRYNLSPCLTFPNGLATFIDAFSDVLPDIRLNVRATDVVIRKGRARAVNCVHAGGSECIEADGIIVATPAAQAATLFRESNLPDSRRFLENVRYTKSVHIVYALERKFLGGLYAVGIPVSAGGRIAVISEDANKCRLYTPEGAGLLHAVTYDSRCRDLWDQPDSVVESELTKDLRAILPHFPARVLFTLVHRWTQGMCVARSGHFAAAAAFLRAAEAISGLEFAGDYLSLPCVEGAVASGVKAAERVIARAGVA